MKIFSKENLEAIYKNRQQKLFALMEKRKVSCVVFEDTESRRDSAVRYFTGHPSDALVVAHKGKITIAPWDENLAQKKSIGVKIVPYSSRENFKTLQAILKSAQKNNPVLDLPPSTPYPLFLKYVDTLSDWDVRCRERGIHSEIKNLRAVKDEYEIECIREAARVTDLIIQKIEDSIKSCAIKTEIDVALFIERELRQNGCERVGFETLAAGPARSFAIHAFPPYTSELWPAEGLSILDFGVVFEGYTSDVTLTVATGQLSPLQKKVLELVERASSETVALYQNGEPVKKAAICAENIFSKEKLSCPHSLGHGIGLDVHEEPYVSTRSSDEKIFKSGMIITNEPGLYTAEGGARLENDILILEKGNEILTHSKIIRL